MLGSAKWGECVVRRHFMVAACSVAALAPTAAALETGAAIEEGWIAIFNGANLDGWKASGHAKSFQVEGGVMVARAVDAPSHLFYEGPVRGADFKNFELRFDAKTTPGSNGGVYFHTRFQQEGFPNKGHEVQVNTSHRNKTRTGSLFGVVNITEVSVPDDVWCTQYVRVEGKRIIIKVNGKTTVDYIEPEGYHHKTYTERGVSSGTFALQAHDPESTVFYRNIVVRPLPD